MIAEAAQHEFLAQLAGDMLKLDWLLAQYTQCSCGALTNALPFSVQPDLAILGSTHKVSVPRYVSCCQTTSAARAAHVHGQQLRLHAWQS